MDFSKEKTLELIERHDQLSYKEEEIKAEKQLIREELASRMKHEQEIYGSYSVSKQKRYSFPTITLDKAKEIGASKEVKDDMKLKRIYLAGGKVDATITEYIVIRNIDQEKTEE